MSCVADLYEKIKQERPDMSLACSAVKALTQTIRNDTSSTMTEFLANLNAACEELKQNTLNPIAVQAGSDHLLRFATRMESSNDLCVIKERVIEYGQLFFDRSIVRRDSIANFALKFITDDATILIHSYSRVVMAFLKRAADANTRFQVLVTEARPSDLGKIALQELKSYKIPCTLILDAAVGYFMGKVDMVLVGAEGIVENGGLINQIGTYQIAVVAKTANKPFYIVTESHKFVRLFPLNQYDLCEPLSGATISSRILPNLFQKNRSHHIDVDQYMDYNEVRVDYTPPQYISLLFTDMGVLTPNAASDELIKFFT